MAEKRKLFSKLRDLFSSNVVVRNIGGKKTKVVDTSRLQGSGSPYNRGSKTTENFKRARRFNSQGYTYASSFNQNRHEIFGDYEVMDEDAIISSALDIFSDESTTKHLSGNVIEILTENEDIRSVLDNLFNDILNIEFNLWGWIRNLCKYGDFYLYLDIKEDLGIVNVIPLSVYDVERIEGEDETNPYQTIFTYQGVAGNDIMENFQVAHFRMVGDTNFLPYGKSMIEGARKIFKQLHLMEDAMMIHRITRAPEKRAYFIDVGNVAPEQVDGVIDEVANETKKTPMVDPNTGQYNLKFNMMNMMEDFYFPVRGDKSGTRIENLPGLTYEAIEDIEYLKSKLFAALKVPKSFLTYDDGLDGKAVLAQQDIRFARTIERVQRVVISELYKIAIVHLYSQGYKDSDLVEFELKLNNPSIVFEREKMDLLASQVSLARDMKELNMISREKIYRDLFKLSDDEINEQKEQVVNDLKEEFRYQQIKDEGNDPVQTNEALGTKGHMLRMQYNMSKSNNNDDKEMPDDGWPGSGRPERKTNYGTDDDVFGRDPIGRKAVQQSLNREKTETFNNHKKNIIRELYNMDKPKEDIDKGTYMETPDE